MAQRLFSSCGIASRRVVECLSAVARSHLEASRLAAWAVAGTMVLAAAANRPTRAATPDEVRQTIEKARQFLYNSAQGPAKDNWETVPKPDKSDDEQFGVAHWQWGGPTGCAVYGLLAAGENPQDKRLAPALAWLGKQQLHGNYAIAMRCQMYPYLPDPTGHERPAPGTLSKIQMVNRDAKALLASQFTSGPDAGLYSYYTDERGVVQQDWWDMSASQISVLGIWACEQAGAEIPSSYWERVDAAWRKYQHADGGWPYLPGQSEARASMTAAGVATLNITQEYIQRTLNWSNCRGGTRSENIERGLGWVDRNISEMLQSDGSYGLYQMYGLERIGVASGRKYFGTVDWGAVGADYLVHHQNANGSFGGDDTIHNPRKIADTVFAILFLIRGRAPVIMNKLEYGVGSEGSTGSTSSPPASSPPAGSPRASSVRTPTAGVRPSGVRAQPDPWNERPRDVANFAHWAGRQQETFYAWQIVNLQVSPDDLHDAPILYISGSESLNFTDEQVNKLREYAQDGGLILGNADCFSPAFDKSFVELGKRLFPQYAFRTLPPDHTIFDGENYKPSRWKSKPRLDGLSNGVRELMLLIPDADAGKSWQTRAEAIHLDHYQFGFDIFQYTGGSLFTATRPDSYIVHRDGSVRAPENRRIKLIRLAADANPDPEPGGWRRLANVLHNQARVELEIEPAKLGEGKLTGAKIAHMTGTTRFTLTADQQKELRDFVGAGGTLIVDAAGGSADFADSAEKALAATFGLPPGDVGVILPPDHSLYKLDGAKIDKVEYRRYARGKINGHLNVPRIRAVEKGGRTQVFYSPEDLSAGMVGQYTDGIIGYDPDTATSLMRNMVLFAAFGNAPKSADTRPGN
jgi:hypothetical protein